MNELGIELGSFLLNGNDNAINSDIFWETFVSKYENIKLVLCGHSPTDKLVLRKDETPDGNVVTQLLVDPQVTDVSLKGSGGAGLVAMLYFSKDGSKIDVEVVKVDGVEPDATIQNVTDDVISLKDSNSGSSNVVSMLLGCIIAFILGGALMYFINKKKKS